MAKLNEFEFKVLNKQIRELGFEEVSRIFEDCKCLCVSTDLNKLFYIVQAISKIEEPIERELVWESAKYTFRDVFLNARIEIAPRFHICEMPVEPIVNEEFNCLVEEENLQEAEKENTNEQTPVKRKGLKK